MGQTPAEDSGLAPVTTDSVSRRLRDSGVALVAGSWQGRNSVEPILHLFEFAYPDGALFLDRAGSLCKRLQERLPGLTLKTVERNQIDLTLPGEGLEAYAGVVRSSIQTIRPTRLDFAALAADFLELTAEVLELKFLQEFRFRYVAGRECGSYEEANKVLLQLVHPETQAKMALIREPASWSALQGEYRMGNFFVVDRIAVMDLEPSRNSGDAPASPPGAVPHITAQIDVRGLAGIAIGDFDAKAFISSFCTKYTEELLAKLGINLS